MANQRLAEALTSRWSNAQDDVYGEPLRDTGDYLIRYKGQWYYWLDSTSPYDNRGPFASKAAAVAAYDGTLAYSPEDDGWIATGGMLSAFGDTPEKALAELRIVRPSRSAAKRQAHRESHMYRQGSRWVVSTWDYKARCNRVTEEREWSHARQSLADWRKRRVAELRGRVNS